ncbi:MAG: patatin-like phospholipase family protein [Acidobacteriota bacterium]
MVLDAEEHAQQALNDGERLRVARRVGLVLSGGSMRCAFQVGVIDLLYEIGIKPSLVVAVSGGVWNGAAIAVGAQDRLRYYWRTFARMPHISLRNIWVEHSPFNYSTLHKRTFRRYVDSERLKDPSSIPLFIGVTRLRDKTPAIFRADQVEDPLSLMLASNYLPPFFTHAPRISGERYGDGGATNNCPYEKAFEEGCDLVVLVTVKGESEGGIYRNPKDVDHVIPDAFRDRTIVIRPRHRVPFAFRERSWSAIQQLMNLGYLRAREVLLGERHPETDLRAPGIAPTVRILKLMRRVSG